MKAADKQNNDLSLSFRSFVKKSISLPKNWIGFETKRNFRRQIIPTDMYLKILPINNFNKAINIQELKEDKTTFITFALQDE